MDARNGNANRRQRDDDDLDDDEDDLFKDIDLPASDGEGEPGSKRPRRR